MASNVTAELDLETLSEFITVTIAVPLPWLAIDTVKVAILPLVRKDGMPEKARELIDKLKFNFKCHYDEKDSIGKRYRRQDAIGTPYCVTIDHQTLEDNTVTIRERDSMEQKRVTFDELENEISKTTSIESLLRQLI